MWSLLLSKRSGYCFSLVLPILAANASAQNRASAPAPKPIPCEELCASYLAARVYPSLAVEDQVRVYAKDPQGLPTDKSVYKVLVTGKKDPEVRGAVEAVRPATKPYVSVASTVPGVTTTAQSLYLRIDTRFIAVPIKPSTPGQPASAADIRESLSTAAAKAGIQVALQLSNNGALDVRGAPGTRPLYLELRVNRSDPRSDLLTQKSTAPMEDWSVVFLRLRRGALKNGDKFTVTCPGKDGAILRSAEIPAKVSSEVAFDLSPSFVQSQQLTNGKTRPVGHLGIDLDEPSLTPSVSVARTYLTTQSVISSDAKDQASNVNLALGAERSLTSSWYLPAHLETKMIGDQAANNVSSVTSTGLATILPWGVTKALLNNSVINAPTSPQFTLDAQLERHIRQDAASEKKFLDKNAFRIFGEATWNAIRLLPGDGSGDAVTVNLTGKGWLIPGQDRILNGQVGKINRMEGLFTVTTLVPVSKLTPTGDGFISSEKTAKAHIQIVYSRGANEANGFKHCSTLSIGLQATTGSTSQ
jgi:hypothetical protein